jgi:hypothetical protein
MGGAVMGTGIWPRGGGSMYRAGGVPLRTFQVRDDDV